MAIMVPLDIESLSVEERLDLIDAIWDSLEGSGAERQWQLTEDRLRELDRRVEVDRANPELAVGYDTIKEDLDLICETTTAESASRR